jgi:hypothetical protein
LEDDEQKFKFIPISQVPIRKTTKWDDIFKKIPPGQALVFTEKEVSVESVAATLRRRHKEGKFKNYRAVIKGAEPDRVVYVMNMTKA